MTADEPSDRNGTAVMPTPPDDIVEAARLAPDHWISVIDPGWDGEGVPLHRVVVGRWRTGATGEIESGRTTRRTLPPRNRSAGPSPPTTSTPLSSSPSPVTDRTRTACAP